MMSTALKLLLTCLFFFSFIGKLWADNPYAYLTNIKGEQAMLEEALRLPTNFGQDTLLIHHKLGPLMDLARTAKSEPLEWAYYLLMADAFSVAYDQVNVRSNFYFQRALQWAEESKAKNLAMLTNIRWGYYYFTYRRIAKAFPYFLRANEYREQVISATVPLVPLHYNYMANFYSYIGDHKKAIIYLQSAIPYCPRRSRKRIDMLNAIGVYLNRDQQMEASERYFKQAMQEAVNANDSVWVGIICGNLADFERKRGNLDKALEMVLQNIYYSERFDEPLDAMRAYIELADIYIQKKEWQHAKEALFRSQGYVEEKPYFLQYKRDIAKAFATIAKGEKKREKEIVHLYEFLALSDSLAKQSNPDVMQKIYWQWESERYNQAVAAAEMKKEQAQRQYQLIGMLLLLIFVIAVLLINRSRNKERIKSALLEKEQLRLAFEKNQVDKELIVLRDSLEEFTNTIKQNDETIQQLRLEVGLSNDLDPAHQEKINESLGEMLENHIMTDERWIKFKQVFDRVYPGFLVEQKSINPRLSENDLRLLALMKLDLSNRSMSDLLGVSIDAVKKAKQRLKKKQEAV